MIRGGLRALFAGVSALISLSPLSIAVPRPPVPPCIARPSPDYPQQGGEPVVMLWTKSDLEPAWSPPACTAWPVGAATIVVGLAGHSNYADNADSLLARLGEMSSLTTIRYWSVTDKKWNTLFKRATALEGLDLKRARNDFTAAELRKGRDQYFVAADNRSGKDAISRLRVTAAIDTHIVVETENITPLRWGFLTYANPGSLQTWYFLDRDANGSWRFYSLTRVLYASSIGGIIPNRSYINRSVAMYRHLFKLPTDRDPPAAP